MRRGYWLDMSDRSIVMADDKRNWGSPSNEQKRLHLEDIGRGHLIMTFASKYSRQKNDRSVKFSHHFFGLAILLTPNLVEMEPSVLAAKVPNCPITVYWLGCQLCKYDA